MKKDLIKFLDIIVKREEAIRIFIAYLQNRI